MEKVFEKIKNIHWMRVWNKSKGISLIVAGVAIMLATVIFIFATDLFLKNNAQWLMISALIGFGAGAFGLLSELDKENKVLTYSLKGVSLALMIGFVVFLYQFMGSTICTSLTEATPPFKMFNGKVLINLINAKNVTMVLTFICTYIGIAAQVFNITSNALLGIEE